MHISLSEYPQDKDDSVSYNSELEESTDKLVQRGGNIDNFEDIQLTLNKTGSHSNIFFREQKIPAYGNLTPKYELKGREDTDQVRIAEAKPLAMMNVRRNLIENLNANKENSVLVNQITPPSSNNKAYSINLN